MPEISNLTSISADELRLRNYRTQLEHKHEIEIRDLEARHTEDIQKISDTQAHQIDELRRAFDVKVSEEAEALEEKLQDIRVHNDQRVLLEKKAGEEEYNKVRTAHQQKVEEYKKNSESQLETLQKQLRTATELLHDQAKKSIKREKEGI